MSEQSLRDALLKLTGDLVARAEEGEPHLFLTAPLRDLESLLAAHPAEPVPVCAGHCHSLTESGAGYIDPTCPKHGRPAPVVTDEPMIRALLDRGAVPYPHEASECRPDRCGATPDPRDPLLARVNPFKHVAPDVFRHSWPDESLVMELARPMPTRKQILLRLQTARGHGWSDEQTAEAVLALLSGGETK